MELENGGTVTANRYNVSVSRYGFDGPIIDLKETQEQWQMVPNGRNWRIGYQVRSEPPILLDFSIAPKDRNY
jgi:hypothetical protein